MSRLILSILLILTASSAGAAANTLTLTWQPDPSWQTAAGGTYLDLPIDTVTASRRLAVRIFADRVLVGEVWDDPAGRAVNVSVPMEDRATAHITAQGVAYECGPWKADTAVSVGDKLCGGEYPSARYYMSVTTAGTTASTEPEWPTGHSFKLARARNTLAVAAVDAGGGTVGLPITAHGYYQGEAVTVAGTTNYNGTYTLGSQAAGGVDLLIIPSAYVAETLTTSGAIAIAGSSVIDNGNGTVNIPCPAHGLVSGHDVTIAGTTNYDASYTLGPQADPDQLTITATYVAEQITGGYAIDKTVVDGGATWTFTDAVTDLQVLTSDPSRRLIGRATQGQLKQSGTRFRLRVAP